MTDSYRMFVELANGAKFRAQGEVADVRIDAERFYALCNVSPSATVKPDTNGHSPAHKIADNNGNVAATGSAVESAPQAMGDFDSALLDRLFAKDKHGTVSLRALPRGENAEGNALVALIYGAGRLTNEQQVTGSRLMKAAAQSGLHQVDRIDRFLRAEIGHHVTTAGFKKGRRYGLTNPGIRRAEEILTAIMG